VGRIDSVGFELGGRVRGRTFGVDESVGGDGTPGQGGEHRAGDEGMGESERGEGPGDLGRE
jgi:hypothetical protein